MTPLPCLFLTFDPPVPASGLCWLPHLVASSTPTPRPLLTAQGPRGGPFSPLLAPFFADLAWCGVGVLVVMRAGVGTPRATLELLPAHPHTQTRRPNPQTTCTTVFP